MNDQYTVTAIYGKPEEDSIELLKFKITKKINQLVNKLAIDFSLTDTHVSRIGREYYLLLDVPVNPNQGIEDHLRLELLLRILKLERSPVQPHDSKTSYLVERAWSPLYGAGKQIESLREINKLLSTLEKIEVTKAEDE